MWFSATIARFCLGPLRLFCPLVSCLSSTLLRIDALYVIKDGLWLWVALVLISLLPLAAAFKVNAILCTFLYVSSVSARSRR